MTRFNVPRKLIPNISRLGIGMELLYRHYISLLLIITSQWKHLCEGIIFLNFILGILILKELHRLGCLILISFRYGFVIYSANQKGIDDLALCTFCGLIK